MMLGHDLAAILPELRAQAESRMTSTARVRRPGGKTTNDDGFEVDGWSEVYEGKFRLGGSRNAGASRTTSIGDVEVALAIRTAHFPASTTELEDGDLIEVVTGQSAGTFLRIVESTAQDQATARRVPVIEAQRPEGWL